MIDARRLLALDQMRGLVMILMTLDHESDAFNGGRIGNDSARRFVVGTSLDTAQFVTRWITHLCAPTFVFLAGAALALSVARRQAQGQRPIEIDRDIAIRGVLLIVLELAWMSWMWRLDVRPFHYRFELQVLYAIGGSMLCMIVLRRVATRWLVAGALVITASYEAVANHVPKTVPTLLLLWDGRIEGAGVVNYPLLPWLAIMMLGWAFGRHLPSPRRLALYGVLALVVFVAIRGINGYGNAGLYREDLSLVQWLHVAKYPPSIAFSALELGLMAFVLSLLLYANRAGPAFVLVLGQTALFFYLLHAHILEVTANLIGRHKTEQLGVTYLAAALTISLLVPLCYWYRRYKTAHPTSWVRFL